MAKKLFTQVRDLLPSDRPFRVSVKVRKGKRLGYAYVNCTNVGQFKQWLVNNEPKVVEVIRVD